MEDQPKSPVVHLERSRTPQAFDSVESLWKEELGQIYGLINKHAAALRAGISKEKPQLSPDKAPLLSIAVFGSSGSGKTSLLKTLREDVNFDETGRHHNRYSLPIIEPNILANDEHFLYAFLAAALDEDLKRETRHDRTAHTLTPLQQEFQNISEYLQVIDKMKQPQEYDPLGLSLERLERHSSGLLLRQKMWNLLNRLAGDLAGKDSDSIVLLPVDDADMAFDNLIATLDTFHRYLLHPRLVPIFTFTGRLAEELLRVHFARNLIVKESQKLAAQDDQVPTTQRMAEHLAVQYMVKLFPIRNRIRLGPAPARVQAAQYQTHSDLSDKGSEQKVWELLEIASTLLFGAFEWPIAPRLRLALRPSTLRRQLQVLDAMYDSRVMLLQEQGDTKNIDLDPKMSWVSIFNDAAWSLLNVHRDVLQDFGMQIEDLYSLTPHNLSREVLAAIVSLDWETRRELIQRWRFQVEDRRGQILSLLALNAFRPQLPGEEPSGDDPDAVRAWSPRITLQQEDMRSFSATKGLVWFLDLWLGFYLPQILARNRLTRAPGDRPEAGGIRSVGWNMRSGPANAIQEVLDNQEISATGMMLLHPEKFCAALDATKKDQTTREDATAEEAERAGEINLALHIWCFYGYKRGKPWVAASFWRGLGLMGLLLDDYERLKVGAKNDGDKNEENQDEKKRMKMKKKNEEEERQLRIKSVLDKHCATSRITGSFQEGDQPLGQWVRGSAENQALDALAKEIDQWFLECDKRRIFPLRTLPTGVKNGTPLREAFEKSFIRRLHGEYLLGGLWPNLGGAYLTGPSDQNQGKTGTATDDTTWNAFVVLEKWTNVVLDYWGPRPQNSKEKGADELPLRKMLEKCPILKPFQSSLPNDALRDALKALTRTDKSHSPFANEREGPQQNENAPRRPRCWPTVQKTRKYLRK